MKKMSAAVITLVIVFACCAAAVKADNMTLTGEVMAKGDDYTLVVKGKTYMLSASDEQKAELAKMNHKMAMVGGNVNGTTVTVASIMMAHKMLTGEVMAKDGGYVLAVNGKNYMLKASDEQKAELAKMDHKTAMVSGDVNGETIMVASVKMAAH